MVPSIIFTCRLRRPLRVPVQQTPAATHSRLPWDFPYQTVRTGSITSQATEHSLRNRADTRPGFGTHTALRELSHDVRFGPFEPL